MSLNVSKQWSALLFAAEFDCQFKDDLISATDADEGISKLPTPLIPIGGIPHLDHWLQSFQSAGITSVFVICSSQCYPHLIEWSTTRGFPASNILRGGYPRGDGSATCTNFEQSLAVALNRNLLVVSGNTLLLESFNLTKVLYEFSEERNFSFFSSVDDRLQPHAFVGDDSSVIDISSSNSEVQGLPALYFYSCRAASSVVDFFKTSQYSLVQQSVATPYAIMKWLIERGTDVEILKVDGIMLIDSIGAYKIADSAFSKSLEQRVNILPHTVTQHCSARVGLMGNPSDGFGGKTLSFLIKNFTAQVTITQNSSCSSSSSRYNSVTIIPHPIFDPSTFSNMGQLQLHTNNKGYYGGTRLLHATCKSFADCCSRAGLMIHLQRGCEISYDTDIPRMVGLSGSSAIVVAAFRALMEFYGLSLQDLKIQKSDFPKIILDIERVELEIACGLQDRVVQTYGGLVHMDFTGTENLYTDQDTALLPPMYLAYNSKVGGESGKVHSTVKTRWQERDPALIAGMRTLAGLTDLALDCLKRKDTQGLAALMERNFQVRRELYGDGAVGALNISMVALAADLGLSAKFTGSGGALLCVQRNGQGWLTEFEEHSAVEAFEEHGFCFQRIEVA